MELVDYIKLYDHGLHITCCTGIYTSAVVGLFFGLGGIWGICCKIDKPGWEACERAEHGGVEGALV